MAKHSLMIARFPGGGVEAMECTDWLIDLHVKLKADSRIGELHSFCVADTPITMVRNLAVWSALELKCDYCLMVDSDMEPDPKVGGKLAHPGAKPFWETSWEFMLKNRDKPCAVAAPYCGPSPHNNIYVFKWRNHNNKREIGQQAIKLDQYTREEAAILGGIQEAAAVPTGLCLYDCRVFETMRPSPKAPRESWRGWFYYEWNDQYARQKGSTEDVTQTRDMSLAWYATGGAKGGMVFCNWDAWAVHIKKEKVMKPIMLPIEEVGPAMKEAIQSDRHRDERLVNVRYPNLELFGDPPSPVYTSNGELSVQPPGAGDSLRGLGCALPSGLGMPADPRPWQSDS